MLEGVRSIVGRGHLVEELGRLQPVEPEPNIVQRDVGERLKQVARDIASDDRRALQDVLVADIEAIDARSENGLHRARNLQARERLDQTVGPALANERLILDEGANRFLEEEWIALGALD